MNCPVCDVALSISSREGVEIDFCPQCRGVWLDRGELDKVIERASAAMATAGPVDPRNDRPPPRYEDERRYERDRYDDRYRRDYDDRYDDHYKRRKKKRSFLDDMFDFD